MRSLICPRSKTDSVSNANSNASSSPTPLNGPKEICSSVGACGKKIDEKREIISNMASKYSHWISKSDLEPFYSTSVDALRRLDKMCEEESLHKPSDGCLSRIFTKYKIKKDENGKLSLNHDDTLQRIYSLTLLSIAAGESYFISNSGIGTVANLSAMWLFSRQFPIK